MGTIRKGILGGFRGQVGEVVGLGYKESEVVRSRPTRKVSQVGISLTTRQTLLKNASLCYDQLNITAKDRYFTNIDPNWNTMQKFIFNVVNKINLDNVGASFVNQFMPSNTGNLYQSFSRAESNNSRFIFNWRDLDGNTSLQFPARFQGFIIGLSNGILEAQQAANRQSTGQLTINIQNPVSGGIYVFQGTIRDNVNLVQLYTRPIALKLP